MTPEQIVEKEVYYNVSLLIRELEKKHEYLDELLPVRIRDDYRSAIEEQVDPAELKEAIADIGYDSLDDLDEGELQELADDLNIEPYTIEALEHWIVSDYLARKLEEDGEMIIYDFLGLTIWGRATSGQMICGDSVIKRLSS